MLNFKMNQLIKFTISVLFLLFSLKFCNSKAIECGWPGRPAFGRAVQVLDSYSEGQTVSYACDNGYYMVGPIYRRCLPNGTWSGEMPICDTTLSPPGFASSSEALSDYPPELAVDGNKRKCFYSTRRKPRWWRMDMGRSEKVISVSITVPFASSEHHFTIKVLEINGTTTIYKKCATFNGMFASQAMILVCGDGKGLTGQIIEIEDNMSQLDHFALCEVEVFVHKEKYECGEPEIPKHASISNNHFGIEYSCQPGYKLEGPKVRICLPSGQWSGNQPYCREVLCPNPGDINNGFSRIIGIDGKIAMGAKNVYGCNAGYYLVGNESRFCNDDGVWSDLQPSCMPIDCGYPITAIYTGGRFKLLNGTTVFKSRAELVCDPSNQVILTSQEIITCREDGTWSEPETDCFNRRVFREQSAVDHYSRMSSKVATILSSVIFSILICLLLILAILFRKKILLFKWSSPNEPLQNRKSSWAFDALSNCNLNGFRFMLNKKEALNKTENESTDLKRENIYEEISVDELNRMQANNQEVRHAVITAELSTEADIQTKDSPPASILAVYAKVDFAQKRRDRLEKSKSVPSQKKTSLHMVPIFKAEKCFIEPSTEQPYFLQDDMLYAGHPVVRETPSPSSSGASANSVDTKVYGF